MKGFGKEYIYMLMMVAFIIISYLLIDKLFSYNLPEFAINLVAAFIGTMVTIALMRFLLQYQMKSEEQKEYKAILFDKKLEIYRTFLQTVFEMDDDNLIDHQEVQKLENQLGEVALVGGKELVEVCTTFIVQLKSYGVLYSRSFVPKQLNHYKEQFGSIDNFISLDDLMQAFRTDLSVVSGSVTHILERVVNIKYDQFSLIKDPNVVD